MARVAIVDRIDRTRRRDSTVSASVCRFPSAPFREERKSHVVATVEQLAALVRGRLVGDGSVPIHSARPVGEAGPGDITFIENERYAKLLRTSPASAAIVGPHFKRRRRVEHDLPVIEVDDPIAAFLAVRTHLVGEPRSRAGPASIPRPASRRPAADRRGRGDLSVRLRRRRGRDRRRHDAPSRRRDRRPLPARPGRASIHPNAVLYADVVLGDRVEVHAGTVLGGDGFGYRLVDGRHVKIPQTGRVEVGDDVEIGANCTIDRATFEATRIGEGTKIDNLVMIGHNNQIGRHNLLCGQVGIAGSCKTGDYVVMAGQAGIKDNTEIGDRVIVGAQAASIATSPAASRCSARRRSRSASSGGSSR